MFRSVCRDRPEVIPPIDQTGVNAADDPPAAAADIEAESQIAQSFAILSGETPAAGQSEKEDFSRIPVEKNSGIDLADQIGDLPQIGTGKSPFPGKSRNTAQAHFRGVTYYLS